jgi:hypothetical protein
LKSRPTSLVDWALAATQAASSRVAWEGKKLCFEKAWLWLSRESEAALLSKIKFAQQNCDALLVDLRDTSGPGGSDRLSLPPFKIPVAVLVNRETREGAVSLAMELKKVAQSEILGEPTASRQSPQQVLSLKNLTSLVLLYPQNSGSLLPDQMVDDRWMYTEGFDGVKERAIQYLQGKLRRS